MSNTPPNELPISTLRSLFRCDFETGTIYHVRTKSGVIRDTAGTIGKDGYIRITFGNKSFGAHRVVWALFCGEWPTSLIDHIDGNRSNNSITNLRLASPSNNAWNRKKPRNAKSPLKGVTWNAAAKKWQSQIRHFGKAYYLGLFATENEAHLAYVQKATELFGEFVRVK